MQAVEVWRAPGTRRGDPVVVPLLGDDTLALTERGRQELRARAAPLRTVTIETAGMRSDILPGHALVIAVPGLSAAGRVTGVRHAADGGAAHTTITVEVAG